MKTPNPHQEAVAYHLDRAKLALAGNLLDSALEQVRAALRLDPDAAEARLLEARIRLRRHEPRLALSALDNHDRRDHPEAAENPGAAADHTDAASPETAMLRATALASSGKTDLALPMMESLAQEFPDDTRVLRALAGMQVHAGHHRAAAIALGRVVALEPEDNASRRLLCDLLAPTAPDAALEALGRIDTASLRRAAQLCRRLDRLAEAEGHYRQLLAELDRRGGFDAEACLDAAEVAELMGEHALAAERLDAVARSPKSPAATAAEAWRGIGRLQLNAGRIGEAGRGFHRAARTAPTDAAAWAGLVSVAQQAGRHGLVRKADARLSALVGRPERRRLLAEAHCHLAGAPGQGRPDAAAHSPLQRMLAETARVMAQTAEKFPRRADVHYHRAVCDTARGETADAGRWLDEALKINPDYAAARELSERLGGQAIDWQSLSDAV